MSNEIHELRYHKEFPPEEGVISSSRKLCFSGIYYFCGHEIWETSRGLSLARCPECDGTPQEFGMGPKGVTSQTPGGSKGSNVPNAEERTPTDFTFTIIAPTTLPESRGK